MEGSLPDETDLNVDHTDDITTDHVSTKLMFLNCLSVSRDQHRSSPVTLPSCPLFSDHCAG